MKTLLLIDGFSIMHRAYYALPELSTGSGVPTNAVYGFFTMLHKVITDFKPTHVVVAFDTPVKTFRKKLYENYQVHRPKPPDGFIQQVPIIKDLLDAAGITRLQKEGYEADDVMATVASKFHDDMDRVFILTSDRDMLQLVDEKTYIIAPQKGISNSTIYTPEEVKNKYGITPQQIPDLKGLMGDSSDNYGGAKGIGPKTAAKLLIDFHDVENMLLHIQDIHPDRVKEIIETHKDNIKLSKQLATLLKDIELDVDQEKIAFNQFKPEMENQLKKLELYSLIQRLMKREVKRIEKIEKKVVKKTDENQTSLF